MSYEDAIRWLDNLKNDIGNPHYERLWPYAQAIDEIIATMEEQEPKPVKVDTRKILDGETDDGPIYIMDTFYRCPSCGLVFSRTNKNYDIRYCEHCGQAVKWE